MSDRFRCRVCYELTFLFLILIGFAPGIVRAKEPAVPKTTLTAGGTVVDSEGVPVGDAAVWSFPPMPVVDTGTATRTDRDGDFQVNQPSVLRSGMPGHIFGMVYKKGFGLAVFSSQIQPMRVILRQAKPVRIRVQDPTGKVVAGASVRPGFIHSQIISSEPPEEWQPLLSQTTNENGRTDISTVVAADLRTIVVKTQAWGTQRISLRPKQGEEEKVFTAKLKRAGEVEGRLLGVDNKPLAGQEVFVSSGYAQFVLTRTDENGRFYAKLPIGKYSAICAAEVGGGAFPRAMVDVKENESSEVELKAVPMGTVKGRFLTDAGNPIVKEPIIFQGGMTRKIGYANANGDVEVQLPVGTWSCAAGTGGVDGYLPANQSLSVHVESGKEIKFDDLVVPTGDVLQGTVRGIDMTEPKIRIILALANGQDEGKVQPCSAEYDEQGKFRMTVPRGTKPADLTGFEVRFVQDKAKVVSTDPFVIDVGSKDAGDF